MAALVSPVSSSAAPDGPSHLTVRQQQQGLASEPHSKAPQQENPPLFMGFNQDHGRFAVGTDVGFQVYDCEPFKEAYRRESGNGGIGCVELLFRSNIVAIVGGGMNPKYPPNKVMIWDNQEGRCIGELSFRSQVRAVKLRRDRIVAALEQKIYMYNFADLKLLSQIDTIGNPKGLCALSSTSNSFVLACPGIQKGQVRIYDYGLKKTKYIPAHDSHLACLALTLDGRLLATASNKGTLIRVFNTTDGTLLQEVRRGAERAEIYSIAFSRSAQWLAVSSDKGTVHVFSLKSSAVTGEGRNSDGSESNTATAHEPSKNGSSTTNFTNGLANSNPGSTFSFMRGVLPRYFSSEWSFSQFRLPDEAKSIIAFGPEKHTVMVAASDGSFYRCAFDPVHGGEMTQREYAKFINTENASEVLRS